MSRTKNLSSASLSELQNEITNRQKLLTELSNERQSLLNQMNRVDQEIVKLGGDPNNVTKNNGKPGRRGRKPGQAPLVNVLKEVLTDKQLSIHEITQRAIEAGYQSTAQNFRIVVSQTLAKHPNIFTKIKRGVYTYQEQQARSSKRKQTTKTNKKQSITTA